MAGPQRATYPKHVKRQSRIGNAMALMDCDSGALWREITYAYGRPDYCYREFRAHIIGTLIRFDRGYGVEYADMDGQERWRLARPVRWAVDV